MSRWRRRRTARAIGQFLRNHFCGDAGCLRRYASYRDDGRRDAPARRALGAPARPAGRACRRPAPRRASPLGILTWSRISHAAATGSMKTACSVGIDAGTRCRLRIGSVRNSRNAPGCLTMPRTVRVGQWRPRPRRTTRNAPQARLISPTTRCPDPRFASVSLDHFADEFMSGRAGESVVATLKFEIGGADSGGEQTNSGEAFRYARQRLAAEPLRVRIRGERLASFKVKRYGFSNANRRGRTGVFQRRLPRAVRDHGSAVQLPEVRRAA